MTNNNVDDKSKIKNAMKWEMWNPWAKWFELNSTHPLISKRLIEISNRSEEFNQKPYIKFDLKKEESYVDDFLIEIFIYILPVIALIIGAVVALLLKKYLLIGGIAVVVAALLSFIPFFRAHKKGYKEYKVEDLLAEVKVSGITSVACIVKGKIIGRGDPGYIFNEDFMVKDDTGIIYADYNSPSFLVNKFMGFFKNKDNLDKDVVVTGWYRRSPVPYIEIFNYKVDGKTHRTGTYTFGIVIRLLLAVAGVAAGVISFIL
jgi:heat shock protein HtpX